MPVSVGEIVEGKVTGVTKFGAFVQLPEGKSGLVHISEVSKDYVERVEDYLKKEDVVKVKVLTIDPQGKISLSIRQAQPAQPVVSRKRPPVEVDWSTKKETSNFEDMMNQYLKDSNDKYDQLKSRDGKKGLGQRFKTRNVHS